MNDELQYLLTANRLPARLLPEQVAVLLGFEKHDISILIQGRFLKPLGSPRNNAVKWFATADIIKLSNDRAFLCKATAYLQGKWRAKNQAQAARQKQTNNSRENKNEMAA